METDHQRNQRKQIISEISELSKTYDPKSVESAIYKFWEKNGFFNPDWTQIHADKKISADQRGSDIHEDQQKNQRKSAFSILMPPTNANGSLHAGHSLVLTIEDIMIRYKRMRGFKTLWLPGLDHAGFETQVVYEKKLEKEGKSRFKMDPEELYKEIWDFTQNNKKNIIEQTKKMGASCDWSRLKFTLDKDIVAIVNQTFKKLYDDGLIYRGRKIISWCPKHQTSLSDLETTDSERTDKFYYLKYGPFTIATARPETKFGDKYVVVHPDDERYKKFKHGQKIRLEWINGPVEATVIKDKAIDREFGTGAMTITPWHDPVDFEIAQRHNLEKEPIINFYGRLLPIAGEFSGMKIAEARPLIIEKLKSKGLLVKTDENYTHTVKTCYKCGNMIEPQIKDQWFVKMKPLAAPAIKAIKEDKIKFIPKQYKKISLHWLNNIIDWNISRQIVWGIRIPAWFCQNGIMNNESRIMDKKIDKTHNSSFIIPNSEFKKMGFAGDIVNQVFDNKTCTYRTRDHGLKIGDKVAFEDSSNGKIFGMGFITDVKKTTVGKIDLKDKKHWKTYNKVEELIAAFKRHYPEKKIDISTPVWIYTYKFQPICPPIITDGTAPKKCPSCGSTELFQDPDVFDTWFSSGQWPFATLLTSGRKNSECTSRPYSRQEMQNAECKTDFETFYPTSVMETAGEIIFFWVARMIMFGLYKTGKIPFENVYLHGLVLDAHGKKMSKSRGNVINPLDITDKYGTDALRIGLVIGNTPGTSLALDENRIKGYKFFANKIWNAARFVLTNLETLNSKSEIRNKFKIQNSQKLTAISYQLTAFDQKDLDEFKKLCASVTKDMDNFKFYIAAEKIYHYFWHTFCDKIIENSKQILADGSDQEKISVQYKLLEILQGSLKLLHPFMPFITEEIYQNLRLAISDKRLAKSIMISDWPK